MAKESDVVMNFKMDGQVQYAQTIKEINAVMNTAASEYKNHIAAMGNDANATEKLTATKKKLEIQIEGAEKRSKMLREEYEKSVAETGAYSDQSKKLYKQLQDSETGQHKLENALEQTNEALKAQGDLSVETAKKLEKIEEAGEKITGVGKGMTVGLTAPIVAIGTAGVAAFNEIDEAIDTIIVKTGATGDAADRLQQSFEKVGSNTHLELQTVGEAIGEVNTQFGFMDEKLEESTDYMLKFAEINGTDVSQSAIFARQAIEAYDMSYEDLNSVLDATTKVAQDTGQSVDTLFDAAIKGAPQIKQLGLSFEEGVALMGQFEQQGVDASGALGAMSKATMVYAKEGKTLSQGMEELQEKIKGAKNETEANIIASEVFGNKAGPKMADAIKRGTLNLEELAETAKNSVGSVGDTFAETEDPIDQANRAMNNAKFALAGVGESVQIGLLPFFELAIDALQRFKGWWDSLDQGSKNWIMTIALVIAAIGPMLVILGTLMSSVTKIVTGIKMLQTVFTALKVLMLANPFVLVIAGIVALIAMFVLAYTKVEWFRNGVNAFFRGIRDVGVEAFKFLGGYVGGIFDGIVKNFTNFKNAGERILKGLVGFVTGVFTGDWKKAWEGVKNIFGGIFEGIAAVAKASLNTMIGFINGFIGGLNNIKIPKWVPKVGGKSFSIGKLPFLATGGHLLNGQAIVGEAGPELLSVGGGKTTVTPLTDGEKSRGVNSKTGQVTIEQQIHFGKVDANNPSELERVNRNIEQAGKLAAYELGGDFA